MHHRCAATGGRVRVAAGAVELGSVGLDMSGRVGPSLVSRGRRHVRVGAVALGNLCSVACIYCWASGFASFCVCHFAFARFGSAFWSSGRSARSRGFRSLGSRVFRSVVLSGAVPVLRVRARGPNSVHSSIRCTTHSQSDVPGVLVLERLRVVAEKKTFIIKCNRY